MSINYRKLGQKIKQFSLTKGLSQEELAEKCNLSTSYISYIETGKKKINFSQLEKISNELNFSIDINSKTEEKHSLITLLNKCSFREKKFLNKVLKLIISEIETYWFDSQSHLWLGVYGFCFFTFL